MQILLLISLIVAAGLLGGIANFYMEQTNAGLRKSIFLGLTAAATVPLLLNTMSSSLTDKCLNGEPSAYFIFFGFCTIAAIFSSKFLQSLGDKLLQELKDVKEKQKDLAETTDALVSQNSDPSEMAAPVVNPPENSDGSELESFNPGNAPKSPSLVLSDEHKIINMLQHSRFAFRTVEGIAKDTGLDMVTAQSKLLELEIQGKVKKTKRARDGVMVWCLK